MAQDINGVFSPSIGVTPQGVSIDDSRRIFNFGERVAELNPASSPFFAYLSAVAKKPTDDPVFKFLEKRHQWQRRNFANVTEVVDTADGSWNTTAFNLSSVEVDVDYDIYGRKTAGSGYKAEFLTVGQMIAFECVVAKLVDGSLANFPAVAYYKITGVTQNTNDTSINATFEAAVKLGVENGAITTFANTEKLTIAANKPGQVIGSAWAEGDTAPTGWRDEFYTNEGYCQIFKTSVPLFSGTALATRYRGDSNEYMRVYQEKLMEHKMDIENALLFGYGAVSADDLSTSQARKSWGILPYTEIHGRVKPFSYSTSGYDDFVDAMSDIFDVESAAGGQKLVLASRSIMNWLNKLGGSSFLGNTMNAGVGGSGQPSSSSYGVDISKKDGMFQGVQVTQVDTLYGTLNFVMEPLLRGPWANHAVAIDLDNVAYRPLMANGESRDTQILTNIQNNNVDGRQDMILTEAGLEISLPETHAVLKFGA